MGKRQMLYQKWKDAVSRSRQWSSALMAAVLVCVFLTGCATAPKARTVGQKVGETLGGGIDTAITWTSKGIKKILNK